MSRRQEAEWRRQQEKNEKNARKIELSHDSRKQQQRAMSSAMRSSRNMSSPAR